MKPMHYPDNVTPAQQVAWNYWGGAISLTNTQAEDYLVGRGLLKSTARKELLHLDDDDPKDFYTGFTDRIARFHPSISHFNKAVYSALVVGIWKYGDPSPLPQGVQVTFLEGDKKADVDPVRITYGKVTGGGSQIGELQEEQNIIGLAEGFETAMSIIEMSETPIVMFTTFGTSGIATIELPPPERVSELHIYADGDEAGIKAMNDSIIRLKNRGYLPIPMPSKPNQDYNDILMKSLERNTNDIRAIQSRGVQTRDEGDIPESDNRGKEIQASF